MTEEERIEFLTTDFWIKQRQLQEAAHVLACALPVGEDRTRFFNMYEIIRTAPRESML